MSAEKRKRERNNFCKKLEELYHNYGIDTSNMDEEEFQSIYDLYNTTGRDIDQDLRESEKHKDKFAEDII
jgi:hypothetical protein